MVGAHLECPPGFTKPPGTVRLIREDGGVETPHLILQPTPSEDPNDPLNWSKTRKIMNFVPVLAITAIIFTQTSLAVIFWVLWVPEFGWTYQQLNNASAINMAGTAVGCFFFIPPAVKYGRRLSYIIMTIIIAAMALWSAKMHTLPELYISNFLFGLANATNETIVEMTIADMFFVHQRATTNGLYMMMVMIGSFLSPIGAGYMAENGNWRLCYWVLFAIEMPLLLYFCIFFEESKYVPRIAGAAIISPDWGQVEASTTSITQKGPQYPAEVETSGRNTEDLLRQATHSTTQINRNIPVKSWKQRLRLVTKTDENMWLIIKESVVVLFKFPAVTYCGLTYAFCLCWIQVQASLVSMVYVQEPYNFGVAGVANMGLPVFIGCLIGSVWAAFSDKTVQWHARKNYGYFEPESRFHMNHLPALSMGSGLIMFGVTSAKGMPWAYPAVGSGIFGFGLGAIGDIAIVVLMDSYQGITGEAFISVAFLRNVFSVIISFALVPWLDAQGLQNMSITQGVMAIALAFLYVPLQIWGKRIREHTAPRYAAMVAAKGGIRL